MLFARARSASAKTGSRSLSTLLVGEHNGSNLSDGTLAAITACQKLGPVRLLLGGNGAKAAAENSASVSGVDSIDFIEDNSLDNGVAEEWTPLVLAAQKGGSHTHVVAPASGFSKNFLPRVAALLDVAQLSDVLEVQGEDTFVRPMYAGNAISTVQSSDPVKVMTVRPTSFEKAAVSGGSPTVSALAEECSKVGKSTWISQEVKKSDRPDLATAGVVVAGGRGLKTKENFSLLDPLATKLNAAIGASRAAVDSGMCPNDMQIGQTGKVVAPDLYVAVGISGAIQHLAGMKDSKTIVAINKDPDAPIFQVSDYGLVADLFEACPELESKL